jgi:hypothetical protein
MSKFTEIAKRFARIAEKYQSAKEATKEAESECNDTSEWVDAFENEERIGEKFNQALAEFIEAAGGFDD